jgi:hypothetical protein
MQHIYQGFTYRLSRSWKAGLLLGCLTGVSTAYAQLPTLPHPYIGFKAMRSPGTTKATVPPIQPAAPLVKQTSPTRVTTNSLTNGQNDDVQLFPSSNSQSEVHISIDKTNPNNLVASSNVFLSAGGFAVGYYYSTNGGQTWAGSDNLPNGGQTSGDPATAYDIGGQAYLVNMAPTSDSYRVQSSGNKGSTWTNQVTGASPAEYEFDKEMIAADDVPNSPYSNTLYSAYTIFAADYSSTIKVNHSTDRLQSVRGQSFSTPLTLVNPSAGHDTGTNVQTGPNGEVYVCWAHYPQRLGGAATGIGFARSTNGGSTFTSPVVAFNKTGIEVNGTGQDPLFNNTRINDFPSMAVDKSNGAHRGRIYIVSAAKENGVSTGKAIIQVRYSDNQGTSWSAPITASISNGRQNWFPWIAVDDTNGTVNIAYYSMDGASGFATNTYVAYSGDGGNSFCNLKVSDASHIPVTSAGQNVAPGYTGDYIGITAYGGKAYPTWADNRTGTSTYQLYTSPVAYATITGPDRICINSNANYSATVVTGASVSWSSSNTSIATINAASGVATGVSAGLVTFTAATSSGCGTISVSKTVQVGTPSSTDIIGMDPSTYFSAGQTVTLSVNESAFGYNWYIYGGTIIGSSTSQSVTVQLDNCFSGQTANNDFDANVTLTDGCGTGPIYHEHTYATCDGGISPMLSIASNPASSTTEVFLSEKKDMTKRVAIKEIKIIDTWGIIRYAAKYEGGKTSIVLDISSLPNNLYTVSAFDGKNWINSKLVKN